MELKRVSVVAPETTLQGLNRTFMELKQAHAAARRAAKEVLIEPLWN